MSWSQIVVFGIVYGVVYSVGDWLIELYYDRRRKRGESCARPRFF